VRRWALLAAVAWPALAHGQTSPGWSQGTVPTPAQWNAIFGSKVDTTGGASTNQALTTPAISGGTISGAAFTPALSPFIYSASSATNTWQWGDSSAALNPSWRDGTLSITRNAPDSASQQFTHTLSANLIMGTLSPSGPQESAALVGQVAIHTPSATFQNGGIAVAGEAVVWDDNISGQAWAGIFEVSHRLVGSPEGRLTGIEVGVFNNGAIETTPESTNAKGNLWLHSGIDVGFKQATYALAMAGSANASAWLYGFWMRDVQNDFIHLKWPVANTSSRGIVMENDAKWQKAIVLPNNVPLSGFQTDGVTVKDLLQISSDNSLHILPGLVFNANYTMSQSGSNPLVTMQRTDTAGAPRSSFASIAFSDRNSGGTGNVLAALLANNDSVTPGAEAGSITVQNYVAGAATNVAKIGAGLQLGVPVGNDKGTGTINAAGVYYANGTAGVTCAGAPTASFASTNGIVIHC